MPQAWPSETVKSKSPGPGPRGERPREQRLLLAGPGKGPLSVRWFTEQTPQSRVESSATDTCLVSSRPGRGLLDTTGHPAGRLSGVWGERKVSSEVARGCHQATAEPGEAMPLPSRAVHSGCSSSKWYWGSRNAGSSQTGPGYQWRCGRGMVKHGLILLYDIQGGGDVHVAWHCMSCIIYIFN